MATTITPTGQHNDQPYGMRRGRVADPAGPRRRSGGAASPIRRGTTGSSESRSAKA